MVDNARPGNRPQNVGMIADYRGGIKRLADCRGSKKSLSEDLAAYNLEAKDE
jgi:hypothetical protein